MFRYNRGYSWYYAMYRTCCQFKNNLRMALIYERQHNHETNLRWPHLFAFITPSIMPWCVPLESFEAVMTDSLSKYIFHTAMCLATRGTFVKEYFGTFTLAMTESKNITRNWYVYIGWHVVVSVNVAMCFWQCRVYSWFKPSNKIKVLRSDCLLLCSIINVHWYVVIVVYVVCYLFSSFFPYYYWILNSCNNTSDIRSVLQFECWMH